MRKALAVIGLPALIILILCAIMIRNADAVPVQRDLTVELAALPQGTRPLKVVVMSDFHVARFGNTQARLRETIGRVEALRPDIVLLAGDFVSSKNLGGYSARASVAAFSRLKAPLGVLAVLGNRDQPNSGRPDVVRRALQEVGVRVLDNEAVRAGPLAVIGVSDAFSGHARQRVAVQAGRRAGGVPIVFMHSPDPIPELAPDIQLAVAGHTHCGQIVLPLIGAVETESRYRQHYLCGVVREGRRTTITTSGLGVSRLPFRLGAPPDFWVITLVPGRPGRG